MASLRSPLDLCDRLGYTPTPQQIRIFDRFLESENPLRLENVGHDRVVPGVAICALWRLLLIPGSRCLVISGSGRQQQDFMDTLHDLTEKGDAALQNVVKWPRSNVMTVGTEAGYELRYISNKPGFLAGLGDGPTTMVALGAGSSVEAFVETYFMMKSYEGQEDFRHIEVW